jgi:L-ascorbate metabolism protein UlaG (beta-lactamase superfamily)
LSGASIQNERVKRRVIPRRVYLAHAGALLATGLGAWIYSQAPRIWNQMAWEIGQAIEDPPFQPLWKKWKSNGLHIAWLGHSTVLIQIHGFNILTDPIFSERAGLGVGPLTLGIKRLVQPALSIKNLPPIDLVLVSHAHLDHLDRPSLFRLENRRTSLITALKTEDLIRVPRYREVHALGWEERRRVGPVTVKAVEVRHNGARMRTDRYRGYNGYLIESDRHRVLFAGDTANTHLFRRLRSSGAIDAVIMPIGAYNPWIRNHCTPEQAWQMANEMNAELFVPIHHQTFKLSKEPLFEPMERLEDAAGRDSERIVIRSIGEEFSLS